MRVNLIIVGSWECSAGSVDRLNSVGVAKRVGAVAKLIVVSLALALIPSVWADVQVSEGLLADALVESGFWASFHPGKAAFSAERSVSAFTGVESWGGTTINDNWSGSRLGLGSGLGLRCGLWLGLGFRSGLWLWSGIPVAVVSLPDDVVDLD